MNRKLVLIGIAWLVACSSSHSAETGTDKSTLVGANGKADTNAVSKLCRALGEPANCDICAVAGWYGDGECDTFCNGSDEDCAIDGGGAECQPSECGVRPLSERLCPDGVTSVGFDRCERNERGTCGWVEDECPVECQASECGAKPHSVRLCPDGFTSVGFNQCERNEDGTCGWVEDECPVVCAQSDCGVPPEFSPRICADGSLIGPIATCAPYEGACAWDVNGGHCPEDTCDNSECGPVHPTTCVPCASTPGCLPTVCAVQSNGTCAWAAGECPDQ